MSQHSQLAAGSGIVPADGQVGDVFAGPAMFQPFSGRRPRRVATVGVEPASFLVRAILWRVFGPAEIERVEPVGFAERGVDADAVVLQHVPDPPSWDALLKWAGNRKVIVDVQVAAAMATAAGHPLRVETVSRSTTPALEVMCHTENRAVYPRAPVTEIVASPPESTGLAVGDRVHLYVTAAAPVPQDPGLRCLAADDAREKFLKTYAGVMWGREPVSGGAVLLTCPTPAGGRVTIMDLHTVARNPEPCGSETPAIQVFLSLLGQSPVTFGRFVVPYAHYSEFVAALNDLTARHPGFASLKAIGRSVEGHDLQLMKIARRPNLPVVLLTCAIHPYEWASIYGVLRYLRFLLERLEMGGFEADELLDSHQIWWVPSACPDGFANRCQQPSAINLYRNFPGGWEYAAEGTVHWGAYGKPHTVEKIEPISLRGPAAASQPETRALMALMDRPDGRVVTLADYHENVGTTNFLHQYEADHGHIPHADYHVELLEGICRSFAGRFFEQRDTSFYRVDHRAEFVPDRVCTWLGYAESKGAKGCVVEAAGGDCTHYRTIRRTEYAAQVTEQVLAAELGRLIRNPWGEDMETTLTLRRRPAGVSCRLYDAGGNRVETTRENHPETITRTVPAGGCLRLRYEEA